MKYPKIKFTVPPPDFADRFPDGDYTVGRGADPRSAAERAAEPVGSNVAEALKPSKKRAKRKVVPPSEAAE
jgi:hypothetical protein